MSQNSGIDEHGQSSTELLLFRWGHLAGQIGAVFIATQVMAFQLPLASLAALMALHVVYNFTANWVELRFQRKFPHIKTLFLAADVLLLTAYIGLSGGAYNPLTTLYLALIPLAALINGPLAGWSIAALSMVCYAVLFVFIDPRAVEHPYTDLGLMKVHLQGVWIATLYAALFLVFFVLRIRAELARQRDELQAARERSLRTERLASLATLAAGAAHELSTPLATIAVLAREIEQALAHSRDNEELREEALVIRQEVSRCRAILDQLGANSGQGFGAAPISTDLIDVVCEAMDGLADRERLNLVGDDEPIPITISASQSFVHALRGVMSNALQASKHNQSVTVKLIDNREEVAVSVCDEGEGIPEALIERVCDPFFTTKTTGRGMGLGLFLATSVADALGGQLGIVSERGKGTQVTFLIPKTTDTPR